MDTEIRKLVELIARDDANAFRQFFDLLYPRFCRFAYHYIPSTQLCEELVSDVFIKIWNNRKSLDQIKQLEFYLLRSVKNQSLTYIKRKIQNKEYSNEELKIQTVTRDEPESLLIAKELAIKIEETIKSLPPKCEMVFRLVRESGLTYKEAAGILEISPRTVDNQMLIAMKKIKQAIDNYYDTKAEYHRRPDILPLLLIFF